MGSDKAWETFAKSGRVCDYLQYAAEARRENDNAALCEKKENEPKCGVPRAE